MHTRALSSRAATGYFSPLLYLFGADVHWRVERASSQGTSLPFLQSPSPYFWGLGMEAINLHMLDK